MFDTAFVLVSFTWTEAVPGVVSSAAGNVVDRIWLVWYKVTNAEPFQSTTDVDVNPVPITAS